MAKSNKIKPLAQDAYNKMAKVYSEQVDTKPYNAYYERPATLSLLPEVKGKRVLDVGCGPGVYSQWLAEHGAQVVAFDANQKMVRLARKRLGDRAQVRLATLEAPLDFALDASFDIIVAPLVMDYVRDWAPVFREFHRILVPGGVLVFSMEHPFGKYYGFRETTIYFETDLVYHTWHGFGPPIKVPSYRRPMSAVINPLVLAGFELDCLLEPLPTEDFKAADPEDYAELIRSPVFLCLRAINK